MSVDKSQVIASLRAHIEQQLARATEAQRDVQQGATHEEARPENDKDTRALEATYLARGLAERVATLESASRALANLRVRRFGPDDPVALGALVTLESVEDGSLRHYLLAPAAGGLELSVDGEQFIAVTPAAPVGRALLGARVGDELQVRTPQGLREMEIVDVC